MAMVYALTFLHSQHVYIGCTKGDLGKRLREHRCLLRKGRHTCKSLQDIYDVGTDDSLGISPKVRCSDDLEARRAMELFVMSLYGERLLNEKNSFRPTEEARRKGVEASRHVEGRKRSPEANEKRRLAQLGKPKGHGAKISATKRAQRQQ